LELASFILPLDDTKAWRLKRRQRILEAAAALFARETYQAVQMDDVAHLAGTGKATVYRYFPSKQELYLEAFDQALGVLEDAIAAAAAAGGSPPERLEAMLRALVATFADQLPSLQILGGDDSHLAERGRQVFRRRAARIADRLRAVIEAGIEQGQFRRVDTEVIARMMTSMCRGAAIAAATAGRERAIDAVLDMALRGGLAVASPEPVAHLAESKRWRTAS
jgi:AcrR family transcriptional regulator